MPVSMFTMNTERLKASDSTATMPSPTTIDTSAIATGTRPATTEPNTSTSTISAAGNPKAISPCSRSVCESLLKSICAG
jgi:hypothetical protein